MTSAEAQDQENRPKGKERIVHRIERNKSMKSKEDSME